MLILYLRLAATAFCFILEHRTYSCEEKPYKVSYTLNLEEQQEIVKHEGMVELILGFVYLYMLLIIIFEAIYNAPTLNIS